MSESTENAEKKEGIIRNFFRLDALEDAEAIRFLMQHMVTKLFGPRELVTEAGRQEQYFYVVEEGVQSLYLIGSSGEKVVLAFSFAGSPSGVYDSFVRETPSSLFVEALKPSKLYALSKPHYDESLQRFPAIQRWKADFFEEILLGRLSREVELLTMSAKERYDVFVARCPPPLLTIPQKLLASYLNMTPETFSRVRGQRD